MWATMSATWLGSVPELASALRHRLVDDRHRAAADQLFRLDQPEVRLDSGRVTVHQQGDSAGRREDASLRVADTRPLGVLDRLVPGLLRGGQQLERHELLVDLGGRAWCLRSTSIMASALSWKPANGPIRAAVRAEVA